MALLVGCIRILLRLKVIYKKDRVGRPQGSLGILNTVYDKKAEQHHCQIEEYAKVL